MKEVFSGEGRKLCIFLAIWMIANLVQAAVTPLHNDEAYYWMYSRYPAWGYYDHPPAIAVMILAGYALVKGELGVRLLTVLAQIATILIAWSLTDRKARAREGSASIFICLILIMPLFNVYGFIAVPDSPLLLFTALFLLSFRRFTGNESLLNTCLLAFSMAGLVYSKYHGALVIMFVILSVPPVLLKPRFWFSALIALLLFVPHILWQVRNDFPSLQYHLVDRVSGIDFRNVPEYLLNQLAVHNPLLIVLTIIVILGKKSIPAEEKPHVFIISGFLLFFFAASFRYHVEPHWTSVLALPIVILLFNSSGTAWNTRKILKPSLYIFIPLILLARLAVVFDFLPVEYLKREFHRTRQRMAAIREIAGERPVVFTNSYQDPSQYTFITGIFSHSLDNLAYRRSQYDIWDFEEKLKGREVLYVPHWLTPEYKKNLVEYSLPGGDSLFARVIPDFQSLQKQCVLPESVTYRFSSGQWQELKLKLFNPYPYEIDLDHRQLPVRFQAAFFSRGRLVRKQDLSFNPSVNKLTAGDTVSIKAGFFMPGMEPGEYEFAITSEAGFLLDVINSRVTSALVTR